MDSLGIRIDQILFQILNFAIVLFVFKKFLFKPILKVLDDRASRVKEGLEAAEKNLKLQTRLEDDKEQLLVDAKTQAKDIVSQAKTQAEKLIKEAQAQAKESAKQALEKERRAFESQMKLKQQEFEKSMVATVTAATNAVLENVVDVKAQKELVEKQIKSLSLQHFN